MSARDGARRSRSVRLVHCTSKDSKLFQLALATRNVICRDTPAHPALCGLWIIFHAHFDRIWRVQLNWARPLQVVCFHGSVAERDRIRHEVSTHPAQAPFELPVVCASYAATNQVQFTKILVPFISQFKSNAIRFQCHSIFLIEWWGSFSCRFSTGRQWTFAVPRTRCSLPTPRVSDPGQNHDTLLMRLRPDQYAVRFLRPLACHSVML